MGGEGDIFNDMLSLGNFKGSVGCPLLPGGVEGMHGQYGVPRRRLDGDEGAQRRRPPAPHLGSVFT